MLKRIHLTGVEVTMVTAADQVMGVQCTASSEAICMLFPDGSRTDVPLEVVARSKALQDAVCATSSEIEEVFTLSVPSELLQAWLQCVELLQEGSLVPHAWPADKLVHMLTVCDLCLCVMLMLQQYGCS